MKRFASHHFERKFFVGANKKGPGVWSVPVVQVEGATQKILRSCAGS